MFFYYNTQVFDTKGGVCVASEVVIILRLCILYILQRGLLAIGLGVWGDNVIVLFLLLQYIGV